jgi:hypothetical protein
MSSATEPRSSASRRRGRFSKVLCRAERMLRQEAGGMLLSNASKYISEGFNERWSQYDLWKCFTFLPKRIQPDGPYPHALLDMAKLHYLSEYFIHFD